METELSEQRSQRLKAFIKSCYGSIKNVQKFYEATRDGKVKYQAFHRLVKTGSTSEDLLYTLLELGFSIDYYLEGKPYSEYSQSEQGRNLLYRNTNVMPNKDCYPYRDVTAEMERVRWFVFRHFDVPEDLNKVNFNYNTLQLYFDNKIPIDLIIDNLKLLGANEEWIRNEHKPYHTKYVSMLLGHDEMTQKKYYTQEKHIKDLEEWLK